MTKLKTSSKPTQNSILMMWMAADPSKEASNLNSRYITIYKNNIVINPNQGNKKAEFFASVNGI